MEPSTVAADNAIIPARVLPGANVEVVPPTVNDPRTSPSASSVMVMVIVPVASGAGRMGRS
jgi:hypothetical protein